ncbi:hypothetical protein OH77DRAFT_1480149 [Trametes cingulata]|nr:hypothetical protein OH77DRAFT_1480149 [Trametes cingulata]
MIPFVPRKVAQKARTHAAPAVTPPTAVAVYTASDAGPSQPAAAPEKAVHDTKGKGKSTPDPAVNDEDLAALLWLSLSDHSLWANVDLRRALASADEGWIPLRTLLLVQSAYFAHVGASRALPESAYVKAVRTHAAELLEVRMRVSAPSKAGWYGAGESSKDEGGGYEIRRKDWREALPRARNSTRAEWESRTVYMECIPLAHRALPSIYHFASSLLSLLAPSSPPPPTSHPALTTRIQAISLPAHHLDRPGSMPKPKGFALVTFAHEEDAARVVDEWPWLPRRTALPPSSASEKEGEERDKGRGSAEAVAREAVKFGFRTLRKARWDELKEEYLAYRQRLLDEISQSSSSGPPRATAASSSQEEDQRAAHAPQEHASADGDAAETSTTADRPASGTLNPDAPFPPGCLVYVRNVHPETNKTTLKALFAAHGFGASASASGAAALDYVDYSKGMTSCHIRLSTPHHALTLVSAFQTRPVVQSQGLDSAGTPVPEGCSEEERAKAISMELVQGTREELYWSKVPEKVRREAVRKAIAQAGSGEGEAGEQDQAGEEDAGQEGGKRKRKRRRKA